MERGDGDERVIVGEGIEAGRCPVCGHDAADGRFCGRCGKRLRDPLPAQGQLSAEEAPAPIRDEIVWGAEEDAGDGVAEVQAPDAHPHRRVFVTVFTLTLVAAAALVVTGGRGAAEIVSTGSVAGATGVTSTVSATDLTTELWRTQVPPRVAGHNQQAPLVLGGNDAVALVSHGGRLEVFDRSTGARLRSGPSPWLLSHTGGDDAGGDVMVSFVDGRDVITLDHLTGRVARSPLEEPVVGRVLGSTVLPDGDLAVVGTQEIRRVRPDGATRWVEPAERRPWVRVVVADGDVLLISSDAGLSAYELGSGQLRWSVELGGHARDVDAVDGARVIVVEEARIRAFDLRTGDELWSTVVTPPVAGVLGQRDGVLYVGLQRGATEIARLDVVTGERLPALTLAVPELERSANGDVAQAGVALEGSQLLVTTARDVVAMGLDGRERWRVAGRSWAVADDGNLLVLDAAELFAVDPRTGERSAGTRLSLPPVPTPLAEITISGGSAALPDGRIVALGVGDVLTRIDGEWWRPADPIDGGYLIWSPRDDLPRAVDPYGATRWRWDEDTSGGSWFQGRVGDLLLVSTFARDGNGQGVSLVDAATGETTDGAVPESLGHVTSGGADWLLAVSTDRDGDTGELTVLRLQDGDLVEVWRGEPLRGWMSVWSGDQLIERTVGGVERRSLLDGSRLPAVRLPDVVLASAFGRDTFVFTTGDDRVLGVDPETTEVRWETSVDGVPSDRLTIAGDVAYLGTLDGRVHLVRLADGELLETVVVGDQPVSQIVVAYGVMLVATGDEVVAFGPASPDDLRIPDLPPRELGEVDVPVR